MHGGSSKARGTDVTQAGRTFYGLAASRNASLGLARPIKVSLCSAALLELLALGVSTGTWDFGQNLARCAKVGDSRLPFLEAVARALAVGDPTGLEDFPEWEGLDQPDERIDPNT